MDGVIVNTSPCHSRAYEDLWREIGIDGPPYEKIAGRKTSEVIYELTEALKPSTKQRGEWVEFKQKQARTYLSTEDITYNDSASCLSSLAATGISLALGTSASRRNTELVLERLGFAKFFPIIITAEDVHQGKPAPDIYLAAIERSSARAEQTLVIEDSVAGLQAAAAAKTYTASVRTGATINDSQFLGSFPNLAELMPAIEVVLV